MKVEIKMQPNPTFYVALELSSEEIRHMIRWMSENTGPMAPDCYKELLVALRKHY